MNQSPSETFHRSFLEYLEALPKAARWFWLLVIASGATAGLGAVGLLRLHHLVQQLVWPHGATFIQSVAAAGVLRRILLPTSAGLLVVLVSQTTGRPLGGHGTAGIIEAIWHRSGQLRFARSLMRGIISILAVSLGASLGREGALIQIGAASSSKLAELTKLPPEHIRLLVACGASAGIAAAYNVPIGGALFGLEVLLGSFAFELFGPVVVSCVVATLISRTLLGSYPSYRVPSYVFMRPIELLRALAVGPLLGLAAALFVRTIDSVAALCDRIPRSLSPLVPLFALALVGSASLGWPELLGNGYDTVDAALLGRVSLHLALLLPLLKLLASALCAGAGVPGGLFTPSLFYGSLIGNALGQLTQPLVGDSAPSGAFALLGMGAALAGTTHAPMTAVVMIFELTGDYSLILPLMLTCTLSAAVSRRFEPDSLYTSALRRRNVQLPAMPRPEWLQRKPIHELISASVESVPPSLPVREVILRLLDLPRGVDLYVVGEQQELLGVLHLEQLLRIPLSARAKLARADEVMETRLTPLVLSMSLAEAAAQFASTELEHLPVVGVARQVVGTVSKNEVLRYGTF